MKVLYLTTVPTPYKVAFFEEFGKLCDLTVLFENKQVSYIADQQGSEKALFKIRKKINQILTVSSATDLASCSKLSSEFRFGKKYVDENRVMHIPNSINATNYFEKISEDEIAKYREEFKIKEGQLIIGHVGFFGYQKNHPFMFKIARRLKEQLVSNLLDLCRYSIL